MLGLKRTHYCGETNGIGNELVVGGFVKRIRDKGGIIFIDLRDRTGVIQLVADETTSKDAFDAAKTVRSEYVLMAKGVLRERESVNKDIKTGGVEILVSELRILSKAQTPPFEITDDTKVGEELRLRYRYLDLRRKQLQDNLIIRHKTVLAAREYFYKNGFIEIETPTFIKSTPEGARDYLVPSRLHAGKFYALPQSPQIYKQLLMISGFDRYIQFARCYRDEDLRADRQPEFTQIDLEMSFVDVSDILEMLEGFAAHVTREIKGIEVELPLLRLTFDEAMALYGTDKPDTRYDMKIVDISETVKDSGFGAFADAVKSGGSVRGIVAKGAGGVVSAAQTLTRKELDKLTEFARGIGAQGLAYIRFNEEAPVCSFSKFISDGELTEIINALNCEKGDVALIAAGKNKTVLPVLGALRKNVAEKLGIISDGFNYVWITDMPFFEQNEETGRWDAMHHPFTCPTDETLQYVETAPEKVYAKAYDLVLNGVELLSGSIRITDYELQERMFEALGLTREEIAAKFGFLVEAYRYASPPHGGAGIGLDRLVMVLCGAESLRDVTAFPKAKDASELMSECPARVDKKQLDELLLKIDLP
ncbi:MAG: aspartate--tRNA ligase [Oscillospiraceae bacterium]|jgi:aspartyl-tRNA synthetase|nr:aspartate--tRNA ligase [Oscillospiraceae bacterium]